MAILSAWIPKKHRGLILSIWASCNNFGNIIGIQLAALLAEVYNKDWPLMLLSIAVAVFIFGILFLIFIIPHPSEKGYVIEVN